MISISFDLCNMLERQSLELHQTTVTGGGCWTDEPPTNLGDGRMANCRCAGPDSGYEVTVVYRDQSLHVFTVTCRVASPGIKTAGSASSGYKVGVAASGINAYQVGVTYWPSHAPLGALAGLA